MRLIKCLLCLSLALNALPQARADISCYLKLSEDLSLSVPVLPSGTQLRGGRGVLVKELNPYGEGHVAIKVAKNKNLSEDIVREARALKRLNELASPHFAKFYELRNSEENPQLVSEWIEGSTLLNLSKELARDPKIPTREAYRVLLKSTRSALLGLEQLHQAGFVHGDIKADNMIYRPDGTAALIDLGSSSAKTETGYEAPPTAASNYAAPEKIAAFLGTPSLQSYGPKSDVYALGISLRGLLDNFQMYRNVSDAEERLANRIISETATLMIKSRLDERPSVDESIALIDQQLLALGQ